MLETCVRAVRLPPEAKLRGAGARRARVSVRAGATTDDSLPARNTRTANVTYWPLSRTIRFARDYTFFWQQRDRDQAILFFIGGAHVQRGHHRDSGRACPGRP